MHEHVLMEDGLVHRLIHRHDNTYMTHRQTQKTYYRIACDDLRYDLEENGSIVLSALTCIECAAVPR